MNFCVTPKAKYVCLSYKGWNFPRNQAVGMNRPM